MVPATSLVFPFAYAEVENLGKLFYPVVQLELKTVGGWQAFDFLVDTGADVTTLPFPSLALLGLDSASLKTSETHGVGGIVISTWSARIPIKIGSDILTVTVSITRDEETPFLLGKKDIFDKPFSLIINSQNGQTIFRKNTH